MQKRWQFAVDVGGTFTDCIASCPNGIEHRFKLLSSGVFKGSALLTKGSRNLQDKRRCVDPTDFWNTWTVQIKNDSCDATHDYNVIDFDNETGTLRLDRPFESDSGNYQYELKADLSAPVIAIRWILEKPLPEELPPLNLRLGTTRGTNALLTRTGAKTALITTKGFKDLLDIGNQSRPALFELGITKHQKLASITETVNERIDSEGNVTSVLDESSVDLAIASLKQHGIESVAICLLNSYRNSTHEQQVASRIREHGFEYVCCSSDFSNLINLVARADTTVVNAYLNPVLQHYISEIRDQLNEQTSIELMTSAGSLVNPCDFSGKDSVLSGPAGGVVGYSTAAQIIGQTSAIGFDMGGTSTDVSRFDGSFDFDFETEKSGIRISTPMMAIETVAAGGGSICQFDGIKLTVGPASAGADPGPACYGRGGPLCVTDLNVYLGRIYPSQFPFPLDMDAVSNRLSQLADQVNRKTGQDLSLDSLAQGLLQIANENMAQAIHSISIAEGYDPREYLLVSFGGAAGQHSCSVAEQIGVESILIHPDAGILSAFGIRHAKKSEHAQRGVYRELESIDFEQLSNWSIELEGELLSRPAFDEHPRESIVVNHSLELRFCGIDASLVIPTKDDVFQGRYVDEDLDYVSNLFHELHQQKYGYTDLERKLELVAIRIQATVSEQAFDRCSAKPDAIETMHGEVANMWSSGVKYSATVHLLSDLQPGERIIGPALITDKHSTTIVDMEWQAIMLTGGELYLEKADPANAPDSNVVVPVQGSDSSDPILLEIYNNLFAAIATQMGITLRNTSASVNVKERLDYSCAIFTEDGRLVVNAPHIPVHLGAMGETVRSVISNNPNMSDGDVFVTNHPFKGGSHLPDVTVVTPIFDEHGERVFFTASRAHHAEIGGISPGSMPPFSKWLSDEGVLIDNFRIIAAGDWRGNELLHLLSNGDYPSRSPEINLQDIQAQVAANQRGAQALIQLMADRGKENVMSYMEHIQHAAAQKMRTAISSIPDGVYEHRDYLDSGAAICVRITIAGDKAVIDFDGTSSTVDSNLNANRAIVSAAVLYVMRLLIDEDIPLNHGVLEPVEIVIPDCLLNPDFHQNPAESPAVAGGNVETSQRVVDVLLHALGLAACSQGTMNNLLFGNDSFGYYETICGGEGGTLTSPGQSAVHTHMTNTRITDPEILEHRYPVRLDRFEIRSDSGGAGLHPGGDGIVRQITFHDSMVVSLLTQRRGAYVPLGHSGGENGRSGVNSLIRTNGDVENLEACCQLNVMPGDSIVVKTPGGGGFGTVE